jgi:folate-dependent tRNA-U54 methylase TrmFO/GidA
MENTSPFLAMQRTEGQLKALLRDVDSELLELAERKAVISLRRLAVDARLDIRDYELSETREDQLRCAREAKRRLARLRNTILAAGPADVAQLTAQLEQIEGWVR